MIATALSPVTFLTELEKATFADHDPPLKVRLVQARTVLLALPEDDRLFFAGMAADLVNSMPVRGMGPVTAFEVIVALGRLLERA